MSFSKIPTGSILPFAGTTAPSGFLICEGATVSRTTYARLFAVIGTSHGSGDGSTTFHLPDMRGRFQRGVNGASTQDPDAASRTAMNTGGNTGNNVGSVQGHSFQTHTHVQNAHNHYMFYPANSTSGVNGSNYVADRGSGGVYYPYTEMGIRSAGGNVPTVGLAQYVTPTNNSASSSGYSSVTSANETRPVNASVKFMIKT